MDLIKIALDYLKQSKDKDEIEIVLKRLFLLECHHNRKVINMINWQSITPQMSRLLVAEMNTEAARSIIGFVNRGTKDYLFSKVVDLEDKNNMHGRLTSLITKIEAVQIIARLDPEGSLRKNQFKKRINNIQKLLDEIVMNVKDV